jgi:hypothetical protein
MKPSKMGSFEDVGWSSGWCGEKYGIRKARRKRQITRSYLSAIRAAAHSSEALKSRVAIGSLSSGWKDSGGSALAEQRGQEQARIGPG